MNRRSLLLPGLALAAASIFTLAGCDVETDTADQMELDTVSQEQPGLAPDSEARQVYEARFEALNESGVTGTATLTRSGDDLQVTVAATGVEPSTRVPMHIHMNSSCDNAGSILLNLDDQLSLANEGEPRGDAYPESDDQGRVEYQAKRGAEELRTAISGEGAAQADSLDLANRVVKLHGPDMQAIACGPIDESTTGRTGQGAQPRQP